VRLSQLARFYSDAARYEPHYFVVMAGDLNLNVSKKCAAGVTGARGFRNAVEAAPTATTPSRRLFEAGRSSTGHACGVQFKQTAGRYTVSSRHRSLSNIIQPTSGEVSVSLPGLMSGTGFKVSEVTFSVANGGVEYVEGAETWRQNRLLQQRLSALRFQERLPVGYWDGEFAPPKSRTMAKLIPMTLPSLLKKRTTRAADDVWHRK